MGESYCRSVSRRNPTYKNRARSVFFDSLILLECVSPSDHLILIKMKAVSFAVAFASLALGQDIILHWGPHNEYDIVMPPCAVKCFQRKKGPKEQFCETWKRNNDYRSNELEYCIATDCAGTGCMLATRSCDFLLDWPTRHQTNVDLSCSWGITDGCSYLFQIDCHTQLRDY